jgi:hypothetical protein
MWVLPNCVASPGGPGLRILRVHRILRSKPVSGSAASRRKQRIPMPSPLDDWVA